MLGWVKSTENLKKLEKSKISLEDVAAEPPAKFKNPNVEEEIEFVCFEICPSGPTIDIPLVKKKGAVCTID